jgi:flagellar biosynthesis protein FlhG
MMRDQAAELRNLVRASRGHVAVGPSPALWGISGGKGGVGTTTVAVNLALALGDLGPRIVLADANLTRGDVAPLCGISERGNIADVLMSRRDVHEVLEGGPGGMQILPGAWAPAERRPTTDSGGERLVSQLRSLGRHAEVVLMDLGAESGEETRRLWSAADGLLLVTTADNLAVMDTYAAIKTLGQGTEFPIHILVNQVQDESEVAGVFSRLDQSCQRFLSRPVLLAGWLPADADVPAAADAAVPLMLHSPQCPAALALQALAQYLLPHVERQRAAAHR